MARILTKDEFYSREELFTLVWDQVGGPKPFHRLQLPKVGLEIRIHRKNTLYEVWIRHQQEKPWKLGQHTTLNEAKFAVYDNLLYFRKYLTGKWSPQLARQIEDRFIVR